MHVESGGLIGKVFTELGHEKWKKTCGLRILGVVVSVHKNILVATMAMQIAVQDKLSFLLEVLAKAFGLEHFWE